MLILMTICIITVNPLMANVPHHIETCKLIYTPMPKCDFNKVALQLY